MGLIKVLEQIKTNCPSMTGRIVGSVNPEVLPVGIEQPLPAAFIALLSDIATPSTAQNTFRQTIRDRFEVALLLDATHPQQALDQLHDLRAEVWRALVGFKPGAEYSPIQYEGGELVPVGNERLLYRLRFFAEFQLGRNRSGQPAETWHERELDGLPSFTGVTVRVDAIDPADPNLKSPGPDGRLELTFSGELKQ
ncbi:MAG: phage tail terminator protein [Pseudomonas sp.]|uniref:phage tail terminator protein n=1 Tax=Pseudomonas sp. TaxID=306 RepID=UPI003D14AD8F